MAPLISWPADRDGQHQSYPGYRTVYEPVESERHLMPDGRDAAGRGATGGSVPGGEPGLELMDGEAGPECRVEDGQGALHRVLREPEGLLGDEAEETHGPVREEGAPGRAGRVLQGQPDPVPVHHVEPVGLPVESARQPGVAAEGDDEGLGLLDLAQPGEDLPG